MKSYTNYNFSYGDEKNDENDGNEENAEKEIISNSYSA